VSGENLKRKPLVAVDGQQCRFSQ